MYNLFKIEFLKYRNYALIGAAVHVAILAFVIVANGNLHTNPGYNFWLLACMVASMLFGIAQMNSHKRHNQWIHLLQRPLAPWKIGMALLAAGCLHLLIALVLPFVLYESVQAANATAFVESRHFLVLGQIIPAILVFYVYAAFSALYAHGLRYLGLVLAVIAIVNIPGIRVELVLVGTAVIAGYCFHYWFKPDLETGASSPLFIVLSELPLHFGCFWLVMMFQSMVTQVGWSMFQTGPYYDQTHDTAASLRSFRPDKETLLAGLREMPLEEANFYRQQIQLGEVQRARSPQPGAYPQRNQRPSLDESLSLTEPNTNHLWNFMHGEMLFKGVDANTGELIGWLGPDGFAHDPEEIGRRFAAVPWVEQNRFVLDARSIRQIDWENRRIREKFSLDQLPDTTPGEFFKISLGIFENFATLLSNTHLYIFRTRQLNDFEQGLRAETRLVLPMPERLQTDQIEVVELIDGYLVGVLVGANINGAEVNFSSYVNTGLFLYRTGGQGGDMLINSRALPSGFATSQIYEGFVLAPGIRLLSDIILSVIANDPPEQTWSFLHHRFPIPVLVLAVISMLTSGLIVMRLLRPLNICTRARMTWVSIAAFSGVVGLACFYFGIYRGSLMMQKKLNASQHRLQFVELAHHA